MITSHLDTIHADDTADPAELEHIPIVETFSRGRSVYQR
jgi:hypothetical protein